jgi:UPF0755 protein
MTLSKKHYLIIGISILVIAITLSAGFYAYALFTKKVIQTTESKVIYIPTGAHYEDVVQLLINEGGLIDQVTFELFAKQKDYHQRVKAGRYKIANGMTANQLVNMLRAGNQLPVQLTFNNIRFLPKLAGIVGSKLEIDSAEFMSKLQDSAYLKAYGYEPNTVISLFLPNTYEFWWNTSIDQFMTRMQKEHDKFWNAERLAKAKAINLSPTEVSVLASIVQEETRRTDEMSTIAGVYINRLKVGMLLQADPTARFAHGDFNVKRIQYDYLKIDSPYNTYQYAGLPPGPICMSNPITIDKVLDFETHQYYYFCAKPDNSGSHAFARNLREHTNNANAYHRYLNRQNIRM